MQKSDYDDEDYDEQDEDEEKSVTKGLTPFPGQMADFEKEILSQTSAVHQNKAYTEEEITQRQRLRILVALLFLVPLGFLCFFGGIFGFVGYSIVASFVGLYLRGQSAKDNLKQFDDNDYYDDE